MAHPNFHIVRISGNILARTLTQLALVPSVELLCLRFLGLCASQSGATGAELLAMQILDCAEENYALEHSGRNSFFLWIALIFGKNIPNIT